MNIDFSNFKKIEESDKHAVLEHPSGHHLKIAKKGLSEKLRKQLEELPTNLAKGGYSKFSQKFDPNVKKQIYQQRPGHGVGPEASGISQVSSTSQPSKDPSFNEPPDLGTGLPKLQVKPKSRGEAAAEMASHIAGKSVYPPCINPSCKSYGHSHPNCRCYGGNEQAFERFAGGGEAEKEYYCDANRTHRKGCEYFKDGGDVQKFAEKGLVEPESDSDKLEKAAQEINAGAPEGSQDSGPQATEAPPAMAANPEMQSNQPEPDVQRQPASQPTETPVSTPGPDYEPSGEAVQTPAQKVMNMKADHMQQLLNESSNFNNELNKGAITQKHYFHLFGREDTLGKIGTAFGLMLGGIGSGLTGQPNAALEIMKQEINNDLNAQQKSVENKNNLLRINQQGFMNQAQEAQMGQETANKAYALTRMQMNNAALHSLVQNAQKLPPGSPQRQQAEQQLAMLNQGVQNENFNIADRAATAAALGNYLNPQSGGQPNTKMMKSGLLGPEAKEVGEDVESKTIPGLGQATLPVPQHVRDQVQAMKTLSDKAADLMQYAGKNVATLSPAKRAIAQQKASEMVNFYNNSIQGGVLTEGRLGWLDDQIKKNPTGVITQLLGNQQRLNEIKQSNDHRMNLMLGQYGVPVKKESQSQQPPGQTATNPKTGEKVILKNGKWVPFNG